MFGNEAVEGGVSFRASIIAFMCSIKCAKMTNPGMVRHHHNNTSQVMRRT